VEVSQEEPQLLQRKLRIVSALVLALLAGAIWALSSFRVQPDNLIGPAGFLAVALLFLLTRTDRARLAGIICLWIAIEVANGVFGHQSVRHIITRFIWSGILILAILLIYRAKRRREGRTDTAD
jgi:hypothetical protein